MKGLRDAFTKRMGGSSFLKSRPTATARASVSSHIRQVSEVKIPKKMPESRAEQDKLRESLIAHANAKQQSPLQELAALQHNQPAKRTSVTDSLWDTMMKKMKGSEGSKSDAPQASKRQSMNISVPVSVQSNNIGVDTSHHQIPDHYDQYPEQNQNEIVPLKNVPARDTQIQTPNHTFAQSHSAEVEYFTPTPAPQRTASMPEFPVGAFDTHTSVQVQQPVEHKSISDLRTSLKSMGSDAPIATKQHWQDGVDVPHPDDLKEAGKWLASRNWDREEKPTVESVTVQPQTQKQIQTPSQTHFEMDMGYVTQPAVHDKRASTGSDYSAFSASLPSENISRIPTPDLMTDSERSSLNSTPESMYSQGSGQNVGHDTAQMRFQLEKAFEKFQGQQSPAPQIHDESFSRPESPAIKTGLDPSEFLKALNRGMAEDSRRNSLKGL